MTRNGRVPATLGPLVVLLLAGPPLVQAGDQETPAATAAEALLSRVEELSGRPLDPRFRDVARRRLLRLAPEELELRRERAAVRGLGGLNAPGDPARDLVYTPVTPCRVMDTRLAGGPPPVGVPRDVRVTGIGLHTQGGEAAGCGVPVGLATAAVLNFVGAAPAGAGNLRGWAYSTPPVGPPTASILNYALVPGTGLNLANAVVVPLCDLSTTTCPFDLRIQPDGNSAQVVIDVLGYLHRLDTQRLLTTATASPRIATFTELPPTCTNLLEVTITASGAGTVLVTTTGQFHVQHFGGSQDDIRAHIGDTPTGCTATYRHVISDGTEYFAGEYTSSFTRSFDVPAAGTYTYYLNAMAADTPGPTAIENYQMFATFYPE